MPLELAACVERADLDPNVHLIALSGEGRGFCAGYDLVESAERSFDEGLGDPGVFPRARRLIRPSSGPTTTLPRPGTRSSTIR